MNRQDRDGEWKAAALSLQEPPSPAREPITLARGRLMKIARAGRVSSYSFYRWKNPSVVERPHLPTRRVPVEGFEHRLLAALSRLEAPKGLWGDPFPQPP